jgi:hypothetical protein
MRRLSKPPSLPGFSPKFTLATLLTALAVIIGGVASNRIDAIIVWITPLVIGSIGPNHWVWITLGISVGVLLIVTFSFLVYTSNLKHRIAVLEQLWERSRKLLALDDSLLRTLGSWIPPSPQNRDILVKQILREAFADAMVAFDGHVERAAVLLPDASGEYLRCWVPYQMPQESIDNMVFYIGSDQQRVNERGVAGTVYLDREIAVGHMVHINDRWLCLDCDGYMPSKIVRAYPPYKSFVCVPIIGVGSRLRARLGVICLDSRVEDVFDSEEARTVLVTFARRMAAAILICDKLPSA